VVAVTGPGLWRDFVRYGMPVGAGQEIGRNFHFSLPALLTNLGYLRDNFHPTPEAGRWWWFVGTAAGLAIIAAAYGACLASRRDLEAQFCLLCTAMLIGIVTVQGHYFVFLVFPLTVAALRIAAKPTGGRVICLGLLVLALNCIDPLDSPFLGRHTLLYLVVSDLPLYALLALAVFFWRELRSHRKFDSDDVVVERQGSL